MTALTVHNLYCDYNERPILSDFSLEVARNEILCLLGPSGCGKTTLLKTVAGLMPIHTGEISVDKTMVNGRDVYVQPEQRNVGMIFQDYALFPHLTVAENISFGLRSLSKAEQNAKVEEMLDLVRLEGLGQRYPHELSGGQQQRVAIARALACEPKLLLLDEPFSNIDSQVRHKLLREIRRILKTKGISAVFVTHSKDEAFVFADRLAVVNEGKVEQVGTAAELYQRPKTRFVAQFLGAANWLPAWVSAEKQLETELGSVESLDNLPHPVGSKVDLMVRPQQFKLTQDSEGPARLLEQHLVGSGIECHLQFGAREVHAQCGEMLTDTLYRLSVRPHSLVTFPAET